MMMMKAAGGPSGLSPLDYAERRRPMPRWMLGAIGVSVLAHGAAGVWLYNQRIATPALEAAPSDNPIEAILFKRPPAPPTPDVAKPPTPIHKPVLTVPAPIPTIDLTPPDTAPVTSAPDTTVIVPPTPTPSVTGEAEAPVRPAPPPVIRNPDWVQKPTARQMERAYPDGALRREVSGSASLRCSVTVQGNLTGCRVVRETPGDQGFGAAALELSRHFRMSPRTEDGRPVEGGVVTVPIQFRPG